MFTVSPCVIWIIIDNIRCDGDNLLDEAEWCHYSSDFRNECAAPIYDPTDDEHPEVVPIRNNTPAVICTCKFSGGERVCANCE